MTKSNLEQINHSKYISRDLSWLQFNDRVLDQAKREHRTLFERLKFLAITDSNLDEFFMIRVGSLYNYIDYGKKRIDYSGLREIPFKSVLLKTVKRFFEEQRDCLVEDLRPLYQESGFDILPYTYLDEKAKLKANKYFTKVIFPMLTPMVYDNYHTFPLLANLRLILGVVSKSKREGNQHKKMTFIQVPNNIPRFFEIEKSGRMFFVPIESIIQGKITDLFRNVDISSVNLFRITRNGDFTLDESEDIDANFLEELREKLRTRKSGRVVRLEVYGTMDSWMKRELFKRWQIDKQNLFVKDENNILDYSAFWQVVNHTQFKDKIPEKPSYTKPLNYMEQGKADIFSVLKEKDILLHHPYNSISTLLELLEKAAADPNTLAIKITIYRLASNSRVTNALLKAAENGKHVSVLFEVKARFDEENNLREAERLQKAGCFVIYGVSSLKTHTKLLLIVRKEGKDVTRFVHLASGNYNESTAKLYTDIGLMTTNEILAQDVSEFFNVITGHSFPTNYQNLVTAPGEMRNKLISLINNEEENAKAGKPSGIVIKINSLQDLAVIDALYSASNAGVQIKLIVRGICCLRPNVKGQSENIFVKSIVGDYLEHSRVYYFHNEGESMVYVGSADIMVRSFDRRMESLFRVDENILKSQLINLLNFNLRDNVNSYILTPDGSHEPISTNGDKPFNIHKEFYDIKREEVEKVKLF